MLEVAIARPQGKVAHLPQREQYETYIANLLPKLNSLAICFARPDFDLAKDLVQESVIKGYQAFMNGGLTLDDRTKAWFATVIRNEFLMHRRKNKRLAGNSMISMQEQTGAETSKMRLFAMFFSGRSRNCRTISGNVSSSSI